MLTENMIEYRKKYYQKNRDYLLNYSKWYYRYLKYEKGNITFEELDNKPTRIKLVKKKNKSRIGSTRENYNLRNNNNSNNTEYFKKKKGKFYVNFD